MKKSNISLSLLTITVLILSTFFCLNVFAAQNQTDTVSIPYGFDKNQIGYIKDSTSTGPQSFYVYKGDFYILDTVQKRIAVFASGVYSKAINLNFAGYPVDLAVANDTIYVLDSLDHPVIYKLAFDGVIQDSQKVSIPTLYKAGQPYSADAKYPVIMGLNVNGNNKIAVVTSDNLEYEVNFNRSDFQASTKGISSPVNNQAFYLEKQDTIYLKSADNAIDYNCTVNCQAGDAEIVGFAQNGSTYVRVGDQADTSKVIIESTVRKIDNNGKMESIALVPTDDCTDYPFKALRVTNDGDVYFMALKSDHLEIAKLTFGSKYESKIRDKEKAQKALEVPVTKKSFQKIASAPNKEKAQKALEVPVTKNLFRIASVPYDRTTANNRAYAINHDQWYYMPYNANPPSGTSTPDWLLVEPRFVYKEGIPYCWGGFDSLDTHSYGASWTSFNNAMDLQQFAGNITCSGGYKAGTAGLDCSGYVGACLGYTWKTGTQDLWNNSIAVSGSPQWMNSYNNYSGHVLFVWYSIDSYNIATLESTTADDDKCKNYQRSLSWLSTGGYSQRTFFDSGGGGGGGGGGVAKPTSSTSVAIPEVTSITIGGETACYEQDDNTGTGSGAHIYIRADLDTEYDLQSAEIVINLVSSGTTVSSTELTFTGGGTTTRIASGVNLLNEKYDVTIGSTTYTLAADTPYGIISVSDSDPLKVADVTFTTSPNVTATVEGMSVNGYAGNPWYEEQQQVQDGVNWVEIKYYVRADDQLPSGTTLSVVPGTMSLATGATPSGCVSGSYPSYTFSLSGPLNIMTVSNDGASRDYHVNAGVEGQVLVYYDIVLDEIEGSQYYTGNVIDQCQEINAAVAEYFDPEGFYVDSGATVMDILLDFIDWAETNNYFSYDTETGGGYYLSELDGLAAFDGGDLSGWMYTDEGYSPTCGVPGVGANYYQLTTDGTDIDWFYTIDYTEHPWP